MQLQPKLILDYAEQLSFQEPFVPDWDDGSHEFTLPTLILAFCRVESDLDPNAVRYESEYRWFIPPEKLEKNQVPRSCSNATESVLQRCSFGLMQIMGATARELRFSGWLTCLCDPVEGLCWGIKYLARQHRRFYQRHGLDGVIAAYNAGSPRYTVDRRFVNQSYVDKIKKYGNLYQDH